MTCHGNRILGDGVPVPVMVHDFLLGASGRKGVILYQATASIPTNCTLTCMRDKASVIDCTEDKVTGQGHFV